MGYSIGKLLSESQCEDWLHRNDDNDKINARFICGAIPRFTFLRFLTFIFAIALSEEIYISFPRNWNVCILWCSPLVVETGNHKNGIVSQIIVAHLKYEYYNNGAWFSPSCIPTSSSSSSSNHSSSIVFQHLEPEQSNPKCQKKTKQFSKNHLIHFVHNSFKLAPRSRTNRTIRHHSASSCCGCWSSSLVAVVDAMCLNE